MSGMKTFFSTSGALERSLSRLLKLCHERERSSSKCAMRYLKIGYGVRGGEPGGAGILLVAERSVEGLGDGAQVEGTDGRS